MILIGIILNYANTGTLALHSPSSFKCLATELIVESKPNRIRLGTQEKVKKWRLQLKCTDGITTQ